MQAAEQPDGTFVISHDRTRLARWFLAAGMVSLLSLAYGQRDWSNEGIKGLLAATAACWLTGLVLWERSAFRFDPWSRTIHWRRRWAWSLAEGSLPFGSVREVLVRSPIGDSGVPSRRLTMKLADGSELPLSRGYLTDHGDRLLALGGRLRQVIGIDAAEVPSDIEALARAGHTLDAVRLRRQTSGVSLEHAVRDARRPDAVGRDETRSAGRD
jgi:hypothetical protein